MFLKVNPPRFVGALTPKVNSRPESETIILLVVDCKIIDGRIWVLVHLRVDPSDHTSMVIEMTPIALRNC